MKISDIWRSRVFWVTGSVLCFLSVLVSACSSSSTGTTVTFKNPDGSQSPVIQAEVVYTPDTRTRGLMYRQELADNAGMLFVFPENTERSFWMKNTCVELDIIFLSDKLEVVSISERAVPLTQSPRKSSGLSKYVLEVKGGMAAQWKVVPGSKLEVSGEIPTPR